MTKITTNTAVMLCCDSHSTHKQSTAGMQTAVTTHCRSVGRKRTQQYNKASRWMPVKLHFDKYCAKYRLSPAVAPTLGGQSFEIDDKRLCTFWQNFQCALTIVAKYMLGWYSYIKCLCATSSIFGTVFVRLEYTVTTQLNNSLLDYHPLHHTTKPCITSQQLASCATLLQQQLTVNFVILQQTLQTELHKNFIYYNALLLQHWSWWTHWIF